MIEFFYSIDKTLFYFCNQTLSNPVFDFIMPAITDWNQSLVGISLSILLIILLVLKGGKKGKVVVALLIPLIFLSDQVSSNLIKSLVARPRPCHIINGVRVLDNIHLLVPCGAGYSFPSSHAANNFAFATLIPYFYPRLKWFLFSYACLMGFSRISVGVHYPSDVIGGALLGVLCAIFIIVVYKFFNNLFSADVKGKEI